ncbi:MAG: TlyA family rRNA (cytidine-2'-O)-methyltransferase [Kiritimatiellia bacterium]|nr:TlyA family rRNA (cytidine-2'-O)-methyltransferase [Kiritimatiellia bacterium]MDP7022662.1 TlyA family rRNA (cytidine-2'-O)-methyltransferase [Kiritimatiellia bacterium]
MFLRQDTRYLVKTRLDKLLVERGLVESREKGQRLVMAGQVLVNGQPFTKAGHQVADDVEIVVKQQERFVSRGGEKLQAAFDSFPLEAAGKDCLDIGASTGGFTDCLLQHGAARVVAVDVGKGQLHWKVRQDERVTVIDKFNARYLTPDDLPFVPELIVVDVSFISLTRILPAAIAVMAAGGQLVTLIKPQFEAGREQVAKGGVVKDEAVRRQVVEDVHAFGEKELGLKWCGVCKSPIRGPAGNVEYLAFWSKGSGRGEGHLARPVRNTEPLRPARSSGQGEGHLARPVRNTEPLRPA